MERLDEIIDAIMEHPLLGQNPNSLTACALGRQGVEDHLKEYAASEEVTEVKSGRLTKQNAIAEMVALEDCHIEQALNARWGEDSDPQLIAYRAWQELKTQHPL